MPEGDSNAERAAVRRDVRHPADVDAPGAILCDPLTCRPPFVGGRRGQFETDLESLRADPRFAALLKK